jgi:hypothetical protein
VKQLSVNFVLQNGPFLSDLDGEKRLVGAFSCLCPFTFLGCHLLQPKSGTHAAKTKLQELTTMMFFESQGIWLIYMFCSLFVVSVLLSPGF